LSGIYDSCGVNCKYIFQRSKDRSNPVPFTPCDRKEDVSEGVEYNDVDKGVQEL